MKTVTKYVFFAGVVIQVIWSLRLEQHGDYLRAILELLWAAAFYGLMKDSNA